MSRFVYASLRFRLLLLVLLAIVPTLGLTLFRNLELRQMVVTEVRAEALRLARLAAGDQQETIKDTHQLLFALAQLPEVRQGDPAACSTRFAQLLQLYPQYAFLGVMTPDGAIFCSAQPGGPQLDLAHQIDFERIVRTGDFTISDYQSDPVSGRATLNFGYPLLAETGQAEAIVFAALDLSWLNQLAAEAQLPEGSTFTVIDRSGTILVRYPDPGTWVGQSVPEAPVIEFIMTDRGEGTAEADGVDGIPRLFAFTPLYGTPGSAEVYVSIGIPTHLAFADANRVLIRNLIGFGLVTLLALTAAWFGSDLFILRRVNRVVEASRRLSAGQLSARTGLPHDQGELGQLAQAFDDMARSLEHRVTERDRAEAGLREIQRALSTLLSNLPGMAYRCRHDRQRPMEFVSEGCWELTGYGPAQLIDGQEVAFETLIHPEDRALVWNEIQAALSKQGPFRLTYRLVTAAGAEKWVWEQGRGVFSPEGELLALEGFITDATERVLAYQTLEQRVADRTRALSALYDVTAVASGSLDLETVLARSLDQVLRVMQSQMGAIHLLDETGRMLHLAAWSGGPSAEDPSKGSGSGEDIETMSTPVSRGLVGWVIERGEPVVVSDLAAGPRPLLALPAGDSHTYLGVPIRARGQALGVLSVIGAAGRDFDPDEVALLDAIADQVGVAVENARLYQQAEQLAVLKERSRLARDLHDAVTQSLYSATLLAEVGRRAARAGDLAGVEGYLVSLGEAVQQALKEMRLLLHELRPPVLEREGLIGALQQRLDAVEGRAGVEARLRVEGSFELPVNVEDDLYRIVQEALNNALKHAAASRVTVRLEAIEGQLEVVIEDNGLGFEPESLRDRGGLGLISMRERAERLGGSLTIRSAPGAGTTVTVRLDVDQRPPAETPAGVTLFPDHSEVTQ